MKTSIYSAIVFLLLLITSCANKPKQLTINDSFNLQNALNKNYGLYVLNGFKTNNTYDFNNLSLVVFVPDKPEIYLNLDTFGLNFTGKYLFKKLIIVQISNNISNPVKDKPCMISSEDSWADGKELITIKEFYSKDADLKNIFEKYTDSSNSELVFLLEKKFAANYADNLNELDFKTVAPDLNKKNTNQNTTIDSNEELPPPPPPSNTDNAENTNNVQTDNVLTIAEQMPEFPGGQDAMMKFIKDNMQYPDDAKNNGVQGTVYIRFVVMATGKIDNIEILRGIDPSIDKEAIRLVKSFPQFKPGKQGGKLVNVYFTIPIKFILDK